MKNRRQKLNRVRHHKRRLLYVVSKRIMAAYKREREIDNIDPDKLMFPYERMLRLKAALEVFMPDSKIWKDWCEQNHLPKPIYLDEYSDLL